jgi:ATP-binding cassette subfamily B protein
MLDDSTSAVDTATDAKIRASFKKYIPSVTKIIVAQRIASIEEADKVIVIDDGKVVAFDTPSNLLKNNKIYQEVYKSQKKGDK